MDGSKADFGPTTYAKINGEATIPTTTSAGALAIPITVYGLGPDGQQLQTGATIILTITQPPQGSSIPEIITRMLGDPPIPPPTHSFHSMACLLRTQTPLALLISSASSARVGG